VKRSLPRRQFRRSDAVVLFLLLSLPAACVPVPDRSPSAEETGSSRWQWEEGTPLHVEVCREEKFGDYSSNVAMECASRSGEVRMNPRELGRAIVEALPSGEGFIERAEVAGPGFINFFIERKQWIESLREVLVLDDGFGRTTIGGGEKVQVEFVSANPTGPLHVGHGRGAAVGDILANILKATGHDVGTEFYINDAGRQVELLARSVLARCRELLGGEETFPEDGYRGRYVYDLAREAILKKGESLLNEPDEKVLSFLEEFSMGVVLGWIRRDLEH
jgi:arginyl-tRNA synthetase